MLTWSPYHAQMRLRERSSLTPEEAVEVIQNAPLILKRPDDSANHHLFYDFGKRKVLSAVVADDVIVPAEGNWSTLVRLKVERIALGDSFWNTESTASWPYPFLHGARCFADVSLLLIEWTPRGWVWKEHIIAEFFSWGLRGDQYAEEGYLELLRDRAFFDATRSLLKNFERHEDHRVQIDMPSAIRRISLSYFLDPVDYLPP